jgi:hypothetical protein
VLHGRYIIATNRANEGMAADLVAWHRSLRRRPAG